MFWMFLIVAAIAIGIFQLGAVSVWVAILQALLVGVIVVLLIVALFFLWRRYKG